MDISKVTFPLYKLRAYLDIDKDLYGRTIVTTIKGKYILDDPDYNGTFEERRVNLSMKFPEKIYKLKEKVIYLRQLVKYKSGSTFIDFNGNILKYSKSSKLLKIKSLKIERTKELDNWTLLYINKMELPILVGEVVKPTTKYASIMYTKWGPFLYDLTSKQHEPYKRKI